MSRRVAFRAWNKLAHKMADITAIDFQFDSYRAIAGKSSGSGHLTDIVLMQYTGLKDSQGKEIYEGDILEVDWNDSRYPVHTIGPVKWDTLHACWQLGEGGMPEDDAKNHMKVIGNRYETPELLTKED